MEEKRYVNQFDTTEKCSEFGKLAEDLFQKFLINNHIFFRKATQEEQFNHIDFIKLSNYNTFKLFYYYVNHILYIYTNCNLNNIFIYCYNYIF